MSNDLKKTIKINPEIFNIGGKTKKNKEKKPNTTNIQLISPNILKNKLLKRIKEHKTKELTEKVNKPVPPIDMKYTNEFNDSIEYLQVLSNNKKKEESLKQKQLYKEDLYKKTLRNNNFSINTEKLDNPYVELELPDELKQNYYNNVDNTNNNASMKLKYNVDNDIPYGCLKGGFKKTFRNYTNLTPTQPLTSSINNNLSERELKLNKLKEKMLLKQQTYSTTPTNTNIIQPQIKPQIQPQIQPDIKLSTIIEPKPVLDDNIHKKNSKIIKQTTLRKYILGKSKNKRTVSILIKDKNTQKKILNAQREIKKKDLPSIKKYLHSHNLMMAGSNAPTDVIRKIYESAMLAGEITNNNKDIMIHNLMKP
jgi:hypothetical protein